MLLRPSIVASSWPPHGPICFRCLARLSRASDAQAKRHLTISSAKKDPIAATPRPIRRKVFRREYFSANGIVALSNNLLEQVGATDKPPEPRLTTITNHAVTRDSPIPPPEAISPSSSLLPHRRRKRFKELASQASAPDGTIPPDASSLLSNLSAQSPPTSLRRLLTTYLSLS